MAESSDKLITDPANATPEGADHNDQQPKIVPMDSFERIEAEILQDAMEGRRVSGFTEDYKSMAEETTFDEQIAAAKGLRKQSKLDELSALDLQWKLEHQEELAEKARERQEVAELIRKAEEKLLPTEQESEMSKELAEEVSQELAREAEELTPELVMLDKIISAADLLRMESSDLSEEEGYRLRLSCILEESESDSSSGVFRNNRLSEMARIAKNEAANVNVQATAPEVASTEKNSERMSENSVLELAGRPSVKSLETATSAANNENALEISQDANSEQQTCVENQAKDQRLTEENLSMVVDREVDIMDSIESSSPEPNFGIQRLKSFTTIDKNLAKPVTKKLESSSDSSLDLSTASPSVDDATKSLETVKMAENSQNKPEHAHDLEEQGPSQSGSSRDISIKTSSVPDESISKAATPENVRVEMENSTESVAADNGYNITEVTDEEIQSMFPKVPRKSRGKSEERETRQTSDSQSTKSFDIRSAAARFKGMFPKIRRNRRGASLESGMAEKQRQEEERKKRDTKSKPEERDQKGTSEPPPVPPETYLWEELRRWRIKGGYPWTHLDKAPFDEKTWKNQTDHEYEPVNPPPLEATPGTSEPAEKNEDIEFNDAHFLRIPRDDELVVSPEDMEVEAIGAARQFQDEVEGRFLSTAMTGTTASRTDCDVNTSMLDSSGLEDLPLKRDSRSKKALQSKTEQMRAQAQGLQQRIRSQAGKLRNKLRSLPRPFPKREQSRGEGSEEEKPRKPKFSLPERPKFNFPERPKFNLPERPKFKMQKPKINLQNLTKPLRERQSHSRAPGEPKRNIFDLDFKTYPRIFNKKSKGEFATSSPKMTRSATPPPAPLQPARKKGPVGQRWVNRFDDIKYVDDRASEMSQPSGRSDRSESLSGFHDRDFAMAYEIENSELPPPRAVSTKSSVSRSEPEPQSSRSSPDRRGRGVLEEIDSDQFFLRQKGISEDDINMEKYLSEEIREAFRSPVVNALRSLDMEYNEDQGVKDQQKENEEPLAPSRTRSLKKGTRVASTEDTGAEQEIEKGRYQNLPENEAKSEIADETPVKIRSLKKGPRLPSVEQVEAAAATEVEKARYENVLEAEAPKARYENIEDNVSEYYKSPTNNEYQHYKSPPSPQEYQHYKTPRPTPAKRKSASTEKSVGKKQNGWVEVEIETELEEIPVEEAPQTLPRRKSKKGLSASRSVEAPDRYNSEGATEPELEPDYIVPETPAPEAPKRARSQSRGARSVHSLAQEEATPIAPKRTSSKSIHTAGIANERFNLEPDTRSIRSLALDERRVQTAPRRFRSLTKGSRSIQSLTNADGMLPNTPLPPERTRSLSRASKASYSCLADDEKSWVPQAPERTRSFSRKSVGRQEPKEERIEAQINHYEMPTENGFADYAVVEKIKPARPPPPRRRKGSRSPSFNTFPRRSPSGPMRPVRNYATLGPSRPPRKTRAPKSAKSVEHIYSSDTMSLSYAAVDDSLQVPPGEDLHGSNKDLQATDVVEKMKARPLPAPPRPPRLKAKSEEQNVSMEVVEEICVSTQTDPLPDDMCLEDDIIQEFSHEQLKIQEAFLREMREEEERIQGEIEAKRARHIDVTAETEENEAKMEIIRQMGDIIQEERRILEDDRRAQLRYSPEEKKTQLTVELEDDMGYASLDRRQPKEAEPSTSFQLSQPGPSRTATEPVPGPSRIEEPSQAPRTEAEEPSVIPEPVQRPPRRAHEPEALVPTLEAQPVQQAPVYIPLVPEIISTERLRVGHLEVDRLSVGQLEANNLNVQDTRMQMISTQEVSTTSLQVQDLVSHSGNLTIRSIELPPEFIRDIIARIPWEEMRPPAPLPAPAEPATTPVQPKTSSVDEEPVAAAHTSQAGHVRRRRRHHRSSRNQDTSEEETEHQLTVRRPSRHTEPQDGSTVSDLSQQLARACTSATVRALNSFAQQVSPPSAGEARTRYVQAVLLVALVAIAGYLLLGWGGRPVHHHHWDFQFPPTPDPPRQVPDDTCRFCMEETETVEHILCACPAISQKRLLATSAWFLEPKEVFEQVPARIAKFLRDVLPGWD